MNFVYFTIQVYYLKFTQRSGCLRTFGSTALRTKVRRQPEQRLCGGIHVGIVP
jgi:hypothetical protein